MGNFVKATFFAIRETYAYLTPDLWKESRLGKTPFQEHTDFLSIKKAERKVEQLQ